jgi:hypothetical protein
LSHVLPDGFHRIRHVGFLANTQRAKSVDLARKLLADRMPQPHEPLAVVEAEPVTERAPEPAACPCCGGRMMLAGVIERASWKSLRRISLPETCDSS